jgi:hypothetical protein
MSLGLGACGLLPRGTPPPSLLGSYFAQEQNEIIALVFGKASLNGRHMDASLDHGPFFPPV